MFTPHNFKRPLNPATCGETAIVTQKNHEQRLGPFSGELLSINPQLTVTPEAFKNWTSNSQAEDGPASISEKLTRDEVTFKIPPATKKLAKSKALFTPSIKAPKANNLSENNAENPSSPKRGLNAAGNVDQPATKRLHSIKTPTDFGSGPSLGPVYKRNNTISKNHDDTFKAISVPESSRVGYSKGRIDILPPKFNLKWKNPWESPGPTANNDQKHSDKSPNPVFVGKSVSSPKIFVVIDNPPGRATESRDKNMTDPNQESGGLASKSAVSHSPEILHDSDELDDDNWELEHDFDLKTTRETVEGALKKLRDLKMQEMHSEDESHSEDEMASKKHQNEIKIGVIRALLKWIPSIHLVALGIEHTGSPENAQRCLVYAAKAIGTLDSLGNNYDLEDMGYGVSVQLRSDKNKVIKEWRNVAGYQPYGILVWVWRDLCLSILSNEDLGQDSGAELVSQIFSDIKSCVPSENYDFREKQYIMSFWDLFLTGGLLANRKGTPRKLADPVYWSGSFVKAKMRLDQLYRADRLNELQKYPSVDLYRSVKSIFPEKCKMEPLEAVRNGCRPSTVNGQIDIFTFEGDTASFERLIENNLLERSSKRYRDILVSFSSMDKEVAEWARKQALIGFEEEVDALLQELLRVFPNVHVAFSTLTKAKDVDGDTRKWFLKKSREGYTESHDGVIATIRVDGELENFDGDKRSPAVDYSFIFGAYLSVGTNWGGSRGSNRERLLREMNTIVLSKVGIIFELNRWVGKTLEKGCKIICARELGAGLDYLLGDFGFEEILNAGGEAKRPTAVGRPKLTAKGPRKKRGFVKKVSRGMAMARAKEVRRPRNITVVLDDDD